MKELNYQNELETIINTESNYTPSLLLHACCAPCSSYVIEYLSKYFNITIIYYNPNIEPIDEYNKRLAEEKRFIKEFKTINPVHIVDCDYDNELFNKMAFGLEKEPERGIRCHKCYRLRLEKTAKYAKEHNYDYFGTTLTVSPYKSSEVLNKIGKELEEIYGINYLYSDFKKKNGYKRSIELSKIYNLYRQDYCGCKFSKRKDII